MAGDGKRDCWARQGLTERDTEKGIVTRGKRGDGAKAIREERERENASFLRKSRTRGEGG